MEIEEYCQPLVPEDFKASPLTPRSYNCTTEELLREMEVNYNIYLHLRISDQAYSVSLAIQGHYITSVLSDLNNNSIDFYY